MIYTFYDLAKSVLAFSKNPMTYQEIWQSAEEKGLTKKLRTSGKTPWQTLGSRLFVDVRDNQESLFIKVGKRPARFFLTKRASEVPKDVIAIIEREESKI
jgi:hypothetical protein